MTKLSLAGLASRIDSQDSMLANILAAVQGKANNQHPEPAQLPMMAQPTVVAPAAVVAQPVATQPPTTQAVAIPVNQIGKQSIATIAPRPVQNGPRLLSSLAHPCDNSHRKVPIVDDKGQPVMKKDRAGKIVQDSKTIRLRDDTRQTIEPLLMSQAPSIQLQICINGIPTESRINLSMAESFNTGNLQYGNQRGGSFLVPLVDAAGQHCVVEFESAAGLYFQARQLTSYPMNAGQAETFDRQNQQQRQ